MARHKLTNCTEGVIEKFSLPVCVLEWVDATAKILDHKLPGSYVHGLFVSLKINFAEF